MRFSLALILASLVGFAGPAEAQKRKKSKDNLATSEKKAANVIKPDSEDDALQRPEDAAIEALVADKEKRLSKVRKRQLKQMRSILRKNPLYKKKADLLFRIAEKEWDEAKYRYFLQRKDYDKRYETFLNGTLKKRPKEPVADYSKALIEYKQLLKEFPNYKRIDEVMFFLGRGLITAGKKKEGASYMLRLTKEYPKSKYRTAAYLAVAEYYFDNDLLFAAKTNYLKVLEDTKSIQYPYALYKLGYVYYNLREYEDSIKSFKRVVDLSKGQDKRKVYFTNQAYSAVTMSFAEVDDGWKRARDYFREMGGQKLATTYLEKIARVYSKQDKPTLEVEVYEYLIGANKEGQKVPEYAERVTASYKKQEDMDKVEKTINRFLTYFDPKGSWYAVNKDIEEPRIRSNQYRDQELDWLIGHFHTKAQELEKLKNAEKADIKYRKAAKYYEKYLELFPKAKDLYEKEFYLAEIYFFQTKQWDKASDHYKAVVHRDPKGKYSKESAYAVILCKEEKMADAGLVKRVKRKKLKKGKRGKAAKANVTFGAKRKDDKFEPIPKTALHSVENEFLEACKDYLDYYPKDKEVPSVSFRSAEIFIKKGHYSEGIKRLEVIMEHHAKHRFAGFAAATLFDANYRLRRWDQMERWGRYMLERRNFKVMKKKQLRDVIAISINEYATELNAKGEKDKAAKEMLRFVKEFPKHEKASIALFNAAAINEQAERTEEAIDLYESVIKRYPKSKQATESHMVLGLLYESQTEFETAANYFEKMASFPDVPQVADALFNAGSIRAALEQYDQAIGIFETFAKKFPDAKETPQLHLQIAEYHEKQLRPKKALKAYDRYIKLFKKTQAEMIPEVYLRKALIEQKKGGKRARRLATDQLKKSSKAFKRLPDEAKEKPKVRRTQARVKFLLAEYAYEDFEAIKIEFPERKLKKSLVKKAELLTKTGELFFEVLDFKSYDVSAGALYRIGESYYLYAKSLFDLPIPEGLTEDEQFLYRAMLDDRAAPLEEKSIEAVRRALELAHKHQVYNDWSSKAASLLAKFSPERFPVLSNATVDSDWPVAATFSTTYIADPYGKLDMMMKPKPKAEPKGAAQGAKAGGAADGKAATTKDAKDAKAGDKAPAKDAKAAEKKPAKAKEGK